uniref:MHC class I-like antigen recognition-like domain-containing protein n=1 Tax=Astyanax mexicanus TaxID=7994 RepID=A0A8B9HQ19_ASTMX
MRVLLLCVFCFTGETASAEKHSLQYLYTLRSAPEDDTEFEITTVFDGLIISHCKSPRFRDHSREDWISQTFTNAEWKNRDLFCEGEYYLHNTLKKKIEDVINTTNGIIQREISCTEDDSVVRMSDRWGVNGEDFLTLDPKTLKWSSDSPLAAPVQSDWNQMKFMTPSLKDFKLNQCKPSLMKLKMKKEEYLQENMYPKMYIFGKSSHDGDAVSMRCYISHKYLSGVRVRLTLDGVAVDNVNISSPAPNMDGSVQIRLETKTNIKEPNRYHCVVDTDYLHIFTAWDGQTLSQKSDFYKRGMMVISWIPLIMLLITLGTAWSLAAFLQGCSFICKKAKRQRNINISNVNFSIYVATEEEFRRMAEDDDEFHGPVFLREYRV